MTTPQAPDPAPPDRDADEEVHAAERAVLRRVRMFAVAAWIAFGLFYVICLDWWGLVGLTCSGAVIMINFLWLEGSVRNALQPAPQVKSWKLILPTVGRFALFALTLSLTFYVIRLNTISVLLGLSIIVAGIMTEGMYTIWKALRAED